MAAAHFVLRGCLKIIPGISLRRTDITTHIPPESEDHVNNDRGTHRQNRGVHKVLPDLTGSNAHPVADGRTNAKGIPFQKAFEFVHKRKITVFRKW